MTSWPETVALIVMHAMAASAQPNFECREPINRMSGELLQLRALLTAPHAWPSGQNARDISPACMASGPVAHLAQSAVRLGEFSAADMTAPWDDGHGSERQDGEIIAPLFHRLGAGLDHVLD